MRVIVCGSRKWDDVRAVRERLENLPHLSEIITGGAAGADRIGDRVADEMGYFRIIFPANWNGQGKAAGPLRNRRMLDMEPDLVIAFRSSGESRGTDDMIRECARRGISCEVINA